MQRQRLMECKELLVGEVVNPLTVHVGWHVEFGDITDFAPVILRRTVENMNLSPSSIWTTCRPVGIYDSQYLLQVAFCSIRSCTFDFLEILDQVIFDESDENILFEYHFLKTNWNPLFGSSISTISHLGICWSSLVKPT